MTLWWSWNFLNLWYTLLIKANWYLQLVGMTFSNAVTSYFHMGYKFYAKTVFYLKLVSAVFYDFFFFHQMIALQKLRKMFLISSKSSFRSPDIQIFVIFSVPFHTFQIQKDKWKETNLCFLFDNLLSKYLFLR